MPKANCIVSTMPSIATDTARVVADIRSLPGFAAPIDYDEFSYASLPLCILDAIFSINARWEAVRAAVRRYANHYALPLTHESGTLPPREGQATVHDLIQQITSLGSDRFASEVMRNRSRTSSRGGILKAEAALNFAEVLNDHGIQTLQDMSEHLLDTGLESDLRQVHGQASGISTRYFYMLAGAHHLIKPDRMMIRYLARVLDRPVAPAEAQDIVGAAAAILQLEKPGITAQLIDAAIWTYERQRSRT